MRRRESLGLSVLLGAHAFAGVELRALADLFVTLQRLAGLCMDLAHECNGHARVLRKNLLAQVFELSPVDFFQRYAIVCVVDVVEDVSRIDQPSLLNCRCSLCLLGLISSLRIVLAADAGWHHLRG